MGAGATDMPSGQRRWTRQKERIFFLLELILVGLVFFQAGTYVAREEIPLLSLLRTTSVSSSPPPLNEHPIPKLMAEAEDAYRAKLERQSTSLVEAVTEYKRRYGRDPPKGFDEWYAYAVKNDFRLVDEFDAIDEDLRPFMSMSGEELRRRIDQVRLASRFNVD